MTTSESERHITGDAGRRWVMNMRLNYSAEVRPISHEGRDGRHFLEMVVVKSDHADGRGAVHLTVDQALYVQSRLSQIAVSYLPHHECNGQHAPDHPTTHPDGPAVRTLARCGAEAWPILCDSPDLLADLEKVVIESDCQSGCGPIHLSPAQALYVEERLTHISLDFLHDKGWGGEDARNQ
jgi:hypothetical protein